MPYKLDSGLSPNPSVMEVADFWEVECLRRKDHSASITDIRKAMQISDDVQEDSEDEAEIHTEGLLDDVSNEIGRRMRACGNSYPFKFDETGYTLLLRSDVDSSLQWLYIFLICATRHKMGKDRIQESIDGTLVFERLSSDVLAYYLGSHSDGYVFGTANREATFYEKLKELTERCGEGVLKEKLNLTYNPNDDKLDIAAWVSFLDGQASKLICYGQCKTGTSWQDTVEQLRADSFVKKWFSTVPSLTPIDAFIIADVVDPRDFFVRSVNRLFFDRCRVMNFASEVDQKLWFDDMVKWTKAVLDLYKIEKPSFAA